MALVTVALLRAEDAGRLPGQALVLPTVEAPNDADDVGVAELSQRVGGQDAARAPGAVDDDRCLGLRDAPGHLDFKKASGNVHRALQGPLLELVRLTDVESDGAVGLKHVGRLVRSDFAHAGAGAVEKISEGGHTS